MCRVDHRPVDAMAHGRPSATGKRRPCVPHCVVDARHRVAVLGISLGVPRSSHHLLRRAKKGSPAHADFGVVVLVGGSPVPPQAVAESKDRVTSPCRLWGRRTYAKAMRSAPPMPVGGNEGPRDPYERPRLTRHSYSKQNVHHTVRTTDDVKTYDDMVNNKGIKGLRTLASTGDGGLEDALEELASGSFGLVPPDPANGTTLTLLEESEEVISTCSQRDPRRSEVSTTKQETYRIGERRFSFLRQDNGPRSSLSIEPGFGRCSGFHREFARRFTEGIKKLAGNMPGDHRGEDQKTCHKYAGGY
ncbi:hypothetical protein BHE74_00035251 [Ensete ventricosum]|nr:hypothetical protein BHE74_00035251 [Ensete ventricosum]